MPTKKYKEALAEAVEACADDTKGQTCYICTQALHWKTKEGLVRMCACRGTAGFVHVSCLAEQAKILIEDTYEKKLVKEAPERWRRWKTCGLCKQGYHGIVRCALGWACWKTYLGRPEDDQCRNGAMMDLGPALDSVGDHEEAIRVEEAVLEAVKRFAFGPLKKSWASPDNMLTALTNLASSYFSSGQNEKGIDMMRKNYEIQKKLDLKYGGSCAAANLANALIRENHFDEAKALLWPLIASPGDASRTDEPILLTMRWMYAMALRDAKKATLDDLVSAKTSLGDVRDRILRLFGANHPDFNLVDSEFEETRRRLTHARLSGKIYRVPGAK